MTHSTYPKVLPSPLALIPLGGSGRPRDLCGEKPYLSGGKAKTRFIQTGEVNAPPGKAPLWPCHPFLITPPSVYCVSPVLHFTHDKLAIALKRLQR